MGNLSNLTQIEETKGMETPLITVVISTRDRGASVAKTVHSILLNDYPNFEVRVVDQSDNEATKVSLQPFLGDPRIRYTRSATKGLSAGRNVGITDAQSEFIACTDDDCEVTVDWLRQLAAAFAIDSKIGVVFGSLLPGPYDSTSGFIPSSVRKKPFLARGLHVGHLIQGMGGCMAVRRSVCQKLGGFDQMLGAGALFKSGEEIDFAIRALLAGYFVYETPDVKVIHHSFKNWEQGRTLIHFYWYGTGAMLAKQLKCGHWSIIKIFIRLAWRWAFGKSLVAASLNSRPSRLLRLVSFIQGFTAGIQTSVNRQTNHFVYRDKSINYSYATIR